MHAHIQEKKKHLHTHTKPSYWMHKDKSENTSVLTSIYTEHILLTTENSFWKTLKIGRMLKFPPVVVSFTFTDFLFCVSIQPQPHTVHTVCCPWHTFLLSVNFFLWFLWFMLFLLLTYGYDKYVIHSSHPVTDAYNPLHHPTLNSHNMSLWSVSVSDKMQVDSGASQPMIQIINV